MSPKFPSPIPILKFEIPVTNHDPKAATPCRKLRTSGRFHVYPRIEETGMKNIRWVSSIKKIK